MALAPELEATIRARLARYIAETPHEEFTGLPDLAKAVGALPVLGDPGGGMALRPDGTVVSYWWGRPDTCREETDPRIRNMVLFGASQKYSELRALAPVRPPDAGTCPHCRGTGIHPMSRHPGLEARIACYCGGIGWIPASDPALAAS